jgi:hypothetical protein
MELTLLTTPGCPHREVFEQRLGLRGSPTLLTDGTDYAVTGGGWLGLALFTTAEAADGRSVIDGHERIVFFAILALALTFETLWCTVRHASAL